METEVAPEDVEKISVNGVPVEDETVEKLFNTEEDTTIGVVNKQANLQVVLRKATPVKELKIAVSTPDEVEKVTVTVEYENGDTETFVSVYIIRIVRDY